MIEINPMHDGREVANYILDYADKNDIEVTNLSLQKILYFSHVWYLVVSRKPLIRHAFEAWEFGPVLPYLYRVFKGFGDQKIDVRAEKLNPISGENDVATLDLNSLDEILLEKVVSFYTRLTPNQLVGQSHVEDGPWYQVWHHESKVNPGMKISNEGILNFYSTEKRPFTLQ